MTTPKNQQSDSSENTLVIVGRLLEASEATSSAMRGLSEESKANAAAAQAAAQAVTSLQHTVVELDRLVRTGNGESLATKVRLIIEENKALRTDVDALKDKHTELEKMHGELRNLHSTWSTSKATIYWVLGILAWTVTTSLSIYGALRGK